LSTWLTKLFHNRSTRFPQADILLKLDTQTRALGDLNHAFTILVRDMRDFEERTTRKLDRYRKWAADRKGGKFDFQASQVAPQSTNEDALVPGHTHKQIEDKARKKGLIS